MKKAKYYIKYGNMYLLRINVSEDYPENEFISSVEFRMSKNYADSYTEALAERIRKKLNEIGFELKKTYLEKKIEEETEEEI